MPARLFAVARSFVRLMLGMDPGLPETFPPPGEPTKLWNEWRTQIAALNLPPVVTEIWEDRVPKILIGWNPPRRFLCR
jgi:hypothetical protein